MKMASSLFGIIMVWLLAGCVADTNHATLQMKEMRFLQSEIVAKAGQPITLQLVNQDGYAHAFDLDEFDIHTPLAAEQKMELIFTADAPGRYTFYCGSPGHQAAGMVGTLVVE